MKRDSEKTFMDKARMAMQPHGCRLFRNNNGMAEFAVKGGRMQKVKYGLGTGTSDLIGWTQVTITEEMVGMTLAVFTAAEGKRGRDKLTDEQGVFLEVVSLMGGISFVFKSPEHAAQQIERWKP